MTATSYSDFTIVRAEARSGGHKMTTAMRNCYATEISNLLSDAVISQGRHRAQDGELEFVWIAAGHTEHTDAALRAGLADIAGAYEVDGIMLYTDNGAEYIEPLEIDTPAWLDAFNKAVSA